MTEFVGNKIHELNLNKHYQLRKQDNNCKLQCK